MAAAVGHPIDDVRLQIGLAAFKAAKGRLGQTGSCSNCSQSYGKSQESYVLAYGSSVHFLTLAMIVFLVKRAILTKLLLHFLNLQQISHKKFGRARLHLESWHNSRKVSCASGHSDPSGAAAPADA